jgi:hypothetical protein
MKKGKEGIRAGAVLHLPRHVREGVGLRAHRHVWGVVLSSLLLSQLVQAQPTRPPAAGTKELVVRVQGARAPGGPYQLQIEPGFAASKAIRVYSEPSHMLLAVMASTEFLTSAEGRAWLASNVPAAQLATAASSKLVQSQITVLASPRPPGDTGVAVWVNGVWPDGTTADQLVADATVGANAFGFSIYTVSDAKAASGGVHAYLFSHCCSSPGCNEPQCVQCTTPAFTCCMLGEPGCCWAVCGHSQACNCTCTPDGCLMN